MFGGVVRWRFRLDCGVSPVRVSMRISSPISVTGASRFRAISTARAFSGDRYSVCNPVQGAAVKSIRLGRKPDRVLPAPVGATSNTGWPAAVFSIIACWWGCGVHPLAWNQSANCCGKGIDKPIVCFRLTLYLIQM